MRPRPAEPAGPGGFASVPLDMSDLERSLGYALRRAQLHAFQEFARFMGKFDVSSTQFAILVLIEANPGLKQTVISEFLAIQKANMVGLIDSLESRGLAERRRDVEDRRAYALYLTAEGKATVRRLRRQHERFEQHLTAQLGAEKRENLLELLRSFFTSAG